MMITKGRTGAFSRGDGGSGKEQKKDFQRASWLARSAEHVPLGLTAVNLSSYIGFRDYVKINS